MKVIFLEVDGVLNTPSSPARCGEYVGIDDDKVVRLKRIVERTKAKIVLISAWKKYWRKEAELKPLQDFFANYLDEKLEKCGLKAFDKTQEKANGKYLLRRDGIQRYVQGNGVENYVILAESSLGYVGAGKEKLVKTNQSRGLTDEQVTRVNQMLLQ